MRRFVAPLAFAAVLVGACAPARVPLPVPVSRPAGPGDGALRAGFDRTDITPPPGYGLFGYGPEAKRAAGYRDRLHVRSMVLQGADGQVVAFAVADLDLVSTLLQRRVAARVAARTDSAIGADRLMLAATHTHSGPGHYLSAWPLNEFGSAVAGYDSVLANWLADRIASSVSRAYGSLAPARAAWAIAEVWGHTRNRAYSAYVLNSGVPARGAPAPDWLPDGPHRAVDPHWVMLRVDTDADGNGRYAPAGALSIFAIHGTGFPAGNDLYDADIQGQVARGLEAHIDSLRARAAAEGRSVHLFANGAEGDVSPNWPPESRCDPAHLAPSRRLESPRTPHAKDAWHDPAREIVDACLRAAKAYVRSLGGALSDTARRIFDDLSPRLRADVTVERAFETLALADSAMQLGICPRAEVGSAAAAGAADGRTRYEGWKVFGLIPLGIEPGGSAINTSRTGCQRPKRAFLGSIQKRLIGRHDFPAYTQLAVVRVGHMLIGTVPGEPTTVTGLRMRAAMRAALPRGAPVKHVALLGLTDGDLRYITTPEEYWAQLYEGGSDLYGPRTGEMLARRLARLTANLPSTGGPRPIVRVDSIWAKPGNSVSRWPGKGARPPSLRFERPPACRGDTVVVRWFDAPPGSMVPADGPVIAFQRVGGGPRIPDDDIDVEVRAIGAEKTGFLWEARYTPVGGVGTGERFAVTLLRWPSAPANVVECARSNREAERRSSR